MDWRLRTQLPLDDVNLAFAELEAAGLLGVVEEGGVATVYLPDRVEGLSVPGVWEQVEDRDWNAAWKAGLQPVTVGRVTVAPPWVAPKPSDAPVRLVIEPGQAFGTGHHETTTGCLAALQELALHGRRVLDVGTGSGVLAIAAARLGAREVVAVDTDPLAVEAARANAEANAARVTVRPGSADAVAGTFDVVLANLDTATLVELAIPLAARLAAGGTLIASGTGVERHAEAVAALEARALGVTVRTGREWAVLVGRRRTGDSRGGPAQDPGPSPGS